MDGQAINVDRVWPILGLLYKIGYFCLWWQSTHPQVNSLELVRVRSVLGQGLEFGLGLGIRARVSHGHENELTW